MESLAMVSNNLDLIFIVTTIVNMPSTCNHNDVYERLKSFICYPLNSFILMENVKIIDTCYCKCSEDYQKKSNW